MAHHAHHESHHASHAGEVHPEVGHVVPVKYLMAAGAALLFLTVITVASHSVDMGEANLPVALFIALIKATIVALVFMHLRWDRPFNLMVLVGSMLFVILMMVFCMMDVGQYESSMIKGNAPAVQTYLDANAKYAPVPKK
jgi:cytochrome c oxidase subunit 4